MSKRINPEVFRESVNRTCSGVRANPFLAGRIMAAEKEEKGTGRKISIRFVTILFILVLAAVAAYAAIGLVYSPVWDGEKVRQFGMPELYAEKPEIHSRELDDIMWELLDTVGDDEYAEVWYEYSLDGENTTRMVRIHEKKKVFETYEEFRQYMTNVDYLTVPSWFPEETEYFYAEAVMGLKADSGEEDSFLWQGYGEENEKAHLIEERMEGQVHFHRYSFDEADTIVKGYMIDFGMKEGGRILIHSDLQTDTIYGIPEDGEVKKVTAPGMSSGILVTVPEPEWPRTNELLMMRNLDAKTLFGTEDEVAEVVTVAEEVLGPEVMMKLFGAETEP